MFPRHAEHDEVQEGQSTQTDDDGSSEHARDVLDVHNVGEGAIGRVSPLVPATHRRYAQTERDAPDDDDPRLGRGQRHDGRVAQRVPDGEEPVYGDSEQVEDGAERPQQNPPQG